MGASGPVRREEFNDHVREMDRWRGEVDEWRRAHDEDDAVESRERRKWSWPEIVVAAITAAGVVAAAAITAFGR